jgi:colanic acid/amylovoran biosynthesis glycosyltransferase
MASTRSRASGGGVWVGVLTVAEPYGPTIPRVALSLAVFVDRFPELTETFVSGELQELRRQGHAVSVEAGAPAEHPDHRAAAGLDVRYRSSGSRSENAAALAWLVLRHPLRCLADLRGRARWGAEEPVTPLRRLAPVARRAARERRDHLHAHFAAGAALDAMRTAALLGLPYSVMTHGYDIFKTPMNLREKHERAAFAVSACDYSVEHLRRTAGAQRIGRLVVGVDGERFRRTTPYPEGRSVIAVARLIEKKGLAFVIEAAALLRARGRPLAALTIVGDGPLRAELEALAARLGEPVTFTGSRTPEQTRALLEDAALLAMPCVVAADGDRDTMPVVVKEALAMEIPVVASDEVGLPEVVHDGWGRLVPPGEAAALAVALDELLALPAAERAAMGARGREFVLRECSLQRETARLAELIEHAARG